MKVKNGSISEGSKQFLTLLYKAPLPLFLPCIFITLFLSFFHGFIAPNIADYDYQALGTYFFQVALMIFVIETTILTFFYCFIYPFVKGFILAITLNWFKNHKILSIIDFFQLYKKDWKTLIEISLSRFRYQTLSLVCLILLSLIGYGMITFSDGFRSFMFNQHIIYIEEALIFIILFLEIIIAGIPAKNGYQKYFFSEAMILDKESTTQETNEENREINKKSSSK